MRKPNSVCSGALRVGVARRTGVVSVRSIDEMDGVLKSVANVIYGGIRPEIPGHGGEECAHYLSPLQMIGETLLTTAIMAVAGTLGWKTLTMPRTFPRHEDLRSKRFLLTFMCVMFGIEIGFKVGNRCLLYLFNPCHVITIIEVTSACKTSRTSDTLLSLSLSLQIWLLASKPGKVSFSTLRYMLYDDKHFFRLCSQLLNIIFVHVSIYIHNHHTLY